MALSNAELQANLAGAQVAYHRLATGQMARVFVDQNGERIEYTAANTAVLYNYIQNLMAQIACPTGLPTLGNAPLKFLF